MDRNNTVALVLISLILIGYFFYTTNKAQELSEQQQENNTEQVENPSPAGTPTDNATLSSGDEGQPEDSNPALVNDSLLQLQKKSQYGAFYNAANGEETTYTLENGDVKIEFSNKGGSMVMANLKNYKTYEQEPLILFGDGDNSQTISFTTDNGQINSSELFFTTTGVQQQGNKSSISFRLMADNGGYLEQVYTLDSAGYLLDYDINLVNLETVIPKNIYDFNLVWKRNLLKQERDKSFEDKYSAIYYRYDDDDVENLSETSDAEETLKGDVEWISFKQQFFNTTLMADEEKPFSTVSLISKLDTDSAYLKDYTAALILPYSHQPTESFNMRYYVGPNHYQTLKTFDNELENIINLGSGIMSWVSVFSKYIIIPVFNFLEQYIGNYGWIILILTLMIKIIVLPLSYKSYLSTAKMKVIKPEMDELKEKYKDDQSKFASEQMKLYSKAGVNPLGGCLPNLIPLPVLIAMYYFFPASIELRQESFLWASDLSTYDSIFNLPFTIPFYGDHVSLFTLLMAVTSIVYALTNQQSATMDGPMKYMPFVFPIMLLGLFNNFPAALTYYYLLQNLISIAQTYAIKTFFIDEEKLHKQIQENKKKPKKEGGFADRLKKKLEEAQREQAQVQQKGKKKK